MISTSGMSPLLALKLINRERETFEKSVRNDALAKREITAFRERIGSIGSVDELMKDREVFGFVMKAYGLEDQIYAKAMMKKILTSDPTDKTSLVSRLTNADYKRINAAMEFGTDGKAKPGHFADQDWVDSLVDRFVGQRIIDKQNEESPTVGSALDFMRNVSTFTNWYKVLADKDAYTVVRTALGLPESLATADIDAQERTLARKMDIADLQDPEKLDKFIRKYAAIAGANEAASQAGSSGILSLFSNSSYNYGNWSPVTIDISGVSALKSYRRY